MKTFSFILINVFLYWTSTSTVSISEEQQVSAPQDSIQQRALNVLTTRCNVCHKKQNPFKIFSTKNMVRHAPKIHHQVFVLKRMPKGNAKPLTAEESNILKTWLFTLNIPNDEQ